MYMASSSGNSSGSSLLQNSGSEEDLQVLMNERKRKRMQSNRESARRSRMRKQKHLDELMAQVSQLRKENNHILTAINITTENYLSVEAENSVLKVQIMELSQRLESLSEILNSINTSYGVYDDHHIFHYHQDQDQDPHDHSFFNPLNNFHLNQPIMASPDMFQY